MKRTKIFFLALMITSVANAQSLADAIKQTTNEQFETADASFKTLIQSQPNNGELYFYYGENYFRNDNLDMANKFYQKGADVNATNPFPYVGLGKVQWLQGKQAEAKTNFFKAVTLAAGKNATVLMKIAELYITAETKNLPEAFNLLVQAAKLDPKNPEVYILTGDAYLEQNNGTKAVENYDKAAVLDPRSVKATLRLGQLYNRSRNFPLALDFYKKASLIDSSFAPAYREKAEIYFRAGQYPSAVYQYKRYLQLNNNCSARGRYAGFLNQARQYKESVDAAVEALKCDSSNAYLYRYKGYSQYEAGDYPNGLTTINKFFDKASKNAAIKIIGMDYEYRAKLLSKNGKDSLAIFDFKKAFEMQPEKVDLNGDIANSYVKMKKYTEAINLYKIKIEFGKPGINDYFGLARAYYQSKDFVNADSAASQMIRLQPEQAVGYIWRAKANSQLDPKNEKWQAKPFYEGYLSKMKPEDIAQAQNKNNIVEAYTYIGVYYINKKDNCTAKTYFKKVQELDAANANAKKFLDSAEAKKCP
ncbi:MAG: tetratricopeptide repeat protein [Bacteroidetes bacterium]|nr:tetratricopeptide repeat protein [Bacteroidota bacterium]